MTTEERFERIERNLATAAQLVLRNEEAIKEVIEGQRELQGSVGALIRAVAAHVEAAEQDRKAAEEHRKAAEEDRKAAEEDRKRAEVDRKRNLESFEELRAILRAFLDSFRRGGNGNQ